MLLLAANKKEGRKMLNNEFTHRKIMIPNASNNSQPEMWVHLLAKKRENKKNVSISGSQ